MSGDIAATDIDLFSDDAVANPYELYREIRDLGAVVWMPQYQIYAVTRYEDVRQILADDTSMISGHGVAFNPEVNEAMRGLTLASDGAEHDNFRTIVASELTPRAVRARRKQVEAAAARLADRVVEQGTVEGVQEIAQAMPLSLVPDIIGLPQTGRDELFDWSGPGIDTVGPYTPRWQAGMEIASNQFIYAATMARTRDVAPGSLAAGVLAAADRGEIDHAQVPGLFIDYLGPALETTASAIGHMLSLFAEFPDQWTLLKEEPDLLASAINETIRFRTPLRGFSREASRDTVVQGSVIPAGARVWPILDSGNRDERKWEDAHVFDIRRNPVDHLGFGYGTHGCAGQGLARLEIISLFGAMLERVDRFEWAGTPTRLVNTLLNAYQRLPLTLVPAKA